MKTKFIKCECHEHVMGLMKFEDEPLVYLQIYEAGFNANNKLSFWQRLRFCWKTIITGTPYEDQMVLGQNSIRELVDVLNELHEKI